MGYYVTITRAEFDIPETDEVLQVLKDASWKFHDWKRGGSYGPNGSEQKWFSWMPYNYDEIAMSVADVFRMLGFDFVSENGKVCIDGYSNKTGQEDLFLAIVAPYVEEGSFIEWVGEDGTTWRMEVIDGRLTVAEGQKAWATPKQWVLISYEIPNTASVSNSEELLGHWIHCDPYSIVSPSEQFANETGRVTS